MKIAVPYNTDGTIYEHFTRSAQLKIYDIIQRKVESTEFIIVYHNEPVAIAKQLTAKDVDIVICGNIGDTAKEYIYRNGMIMFGGVSGNADKAVNDFIEGNLKYDPKVATEFNGEDGDEIECECGCHHHEHNDSCGCGDHACGEGCQDGCCSDGGCCGGCKQ